MTIINLETLATELSGPVAATSLVTFQYWAGDKPYVSVAGDEVIFPKMIRVNLNDGTTPPELDLIPTSVYNCLKVSIFYDGFTESRYVSIPGTGPVDFGDLLQVDPDTLEASNTTLSAWVATLAQVESARDAAISAATAAEQSETNAATSASDLSSAVSAAQAAQLAAEQAADEVVVDVAASADWTGAVTVTTAQSKSALLKRLLIGNVVVTVEAGETDVAYSCVLLLTQDTVGSRTILFSNVRTAFSVAIPLSTPANSVDKIVLEWDGAIWSAYLGGSQLGIPSTWVV